MRPLETGTGPAAQSAAKDGLVAQTFDVLAGGHQQRGGVPGADRDAVDGDRRGLGDELRELLVEQLDLAVELGDASCERPQRGLGRLLGLPEPSRVGAQAFAQPRASALGLARRQLSAQILGSGDDQAAERVQRGAARLDGAVARDPQLADRLDDPARVLGDHGPVGGQHVAGGQFGVDRIALAAPPARVRVRLVDLEHLQALGAQVTHQPSGIAARRLHADRGDRRERARSTRAARDSRRHRPRTSALASSRPQRDTPGWVRPRLVDVAASAARRRCGCRSMARAWRAPIRHRM